jgi:uncharacterized membrane protein YkoI
MSFRGLRNMRFALLVVVGHALLCSAPGHARDGHDHDRARHALEAGEVMPLRVILDRVEREYPGRIMEVELERQEDRWVYEIKLLRPGGTLMKLKVDGHSGELLGAKERQRSEGRPNADTGGGR